MKLMPVISGGHHANGIRNKTGIEGDHGPLVNSRGPMTGDNFDPAGLMFQELSDEMFKLWNFWRANCKQINACIVKEVCSISLRM